MVSVGSIFLSIDRNKEDGQFPKTANKTSIHFYFEEMIRCLKLVDGLKFKYRMRLEKGQMIVLVSIRELCHDLLYIWISN